ncbi:hypothetical protein KCU63_g19254, partial [Aureobasidium melanogenum]
VSAAGPQATTNPAIQSAISSIYGQASSALSSAASYRSSTSANFLIASLLSSGARPASTAITSNVAAVSSALAAVGPKATVDPILSTAVSNLLVGATGAVGGVVVAQQSALSAAMASVTGTPAQASARAQSALQGAQSSIWAPILSGASSVGAQASSLGSSRVASAISTLAADINSAVSFNLPIQSSVAGYVASNLNPAVPTTTPVVFGGPSGFLTSYRPTATVRGSASGSASAAPTGLNLLPPSAGVNASTVADSVNTIEFCDAILTCHDGVVASGSITASSVVDTLVIDELTEINFCGTTLRCGDNGVSSSRHSLSVVASANVDVEVQDDDA